MSWIEFKGVRSNDLNMLVQKMPDYTFASKHFIQHDIPGRGRVFINDKFSEPIKLAVTLNCYGADNTRQFAIREWLYDSGDLVFSDDTEHCYHAWVVDRPVVNRFRCADGTIYDSIRVTFTCEPYLYETNPDVFTLVRSGSAIIGEGTVDAEPLIVVNGTGDVSLTIGDTVLTLTGLTGSITIDCQKRIAYSEATSLSHLVSGEWPLLSHTESTTVSWAGSVSSVVITPNWRWL